MDRTRNCRRSDATGHHQADLAAACGASVKKRGLQPHLIRYGLTPPQEPERDGQIKAVCSVYAEATERAEQGEVIVSTDELTGVQALERKHPGLPLAAFEGRATGV